ncbi:glutaredoxin-like protein NrdH (plasmid) [Rathayibacter sp. VKM Ac-2759]|uniref:glutaredoxin-like protein NrdH n=1 Tax=Rathayibacter TaxID=33886 RepID=UPI0013170607|nr:MULTISPECIES: glutaredoxin-like protein NrdH [Rathayibacter]MCJ1697832.1 glutaredoxin-like protein NrdH [Rathayibacter caricis]QHC68729.1 glutaredoxin-like protein NrdH [Rathayibacter sp. VKM Ac-2759]
MALTVYSKPSCVQCTMTYRVLEKKGIKYTTVDITTNPAALAYITEELGYSAAPVVVASDEDHWSGFRPDLIEKHAA